MIKTSKISIFNNPEYQKTITVIKSRDVNVTREAITQNGKEIIIYHEGIRQDGWNSISISKNDGSQQVITGFFKRWKRKYDYDFENIDFPDEESLCLFLMELHS